MPRTTIAQSPISRLLLRIQSPLAVTTISPLARRLIASTGQKPSKNPDITAPRVAPKAPENSNGSDRNNNKNNGGVDSRHEKTVAQQDEELRKKMSGMAGDGGEAGVEYEDGKPVAMKRGVRNNMFRYI
ncbi:hypothetical protein F5Y10DRAFT_254273 [Nemania abortiva]|nr:hypothetical protein F5Y10DRAFT_254273 [Nemania abortiva]